MLIDLELNGCVNPLIEIHKKEVMISDEFISNECKKCIDAKKIAYFVLQDKIEEMEHNIEMFYAFLTPIEQKKLPDYINQRELNIKMLKDAMRIISFF